MDGFGLGVDQCSDNNGSQEVSRSSSQLCDAHAMAFSAGGQMGCLKVFHRLVLFSLAKNICPLFDH